jgi:hypothetical protein
MATVLSQMTGIAVLFVRKQAKSYGTRRLAEGGDPMARTVTLIEDVITTGGAVISAARALRELGATVTMAVCAIDRSPSGARDLSDEGIAVQSILSEALLDAAGKPRNHPHLPLLGACWLADLHYAVAIRWQRRRMRIIGFWVSGCAIDAAERPTAAMSAGSASQEIVGAACAVTGCPRGWLVGVAPPDRVYGGQFGGRRWLHPGQFPRDA